MSIYFTTFNGFLLLLPLLLIYIVPLAAMYFGGGRLAKKYFKNEDSKIRARRFANIAAALLYTFALLMFVLLPHENGIGYVFTTIYGFLIVPMLLVIYLFNYRFNLPRNLKFRYTIPLTILYIIDIGFLLYAIDYFTRCGAACE